MRTSAIGLPTAVAIHGCRTVCCTTGTVTICGTGAGAT